MADIPSPISANDAAAEWWADWFAEDYSWDALGGYGHHNQPERPWQGYSVEPDGLIVPSTSATKGARLATLQDYWRGIPGGRILTDEELTKRGILVGFEGRRWHVAHLPLKHLEKGNPKSNINSLVSSELSVRIKSSSSSRIKRDDYRPDGKHASVDGRLQLSGCVLHSLPDSQFPHINARRVFIKQRLSAVDGGFGDDAELSLAFLDGGAWISGFDGHGVRFNGSTSVGRFYLWSNCDGIFDLSNCVLLGGLDIQNAEISQLHAHSMDVHGSLWILNSKFSEDCELSIGIFRRNARFEGTTFHRNFGLNWAKAAEQVSFTSTRFKGPVSVRGSTFNGPLYAGRRVAGRPKNPTAYFDENCSFENSVFLDVVDLTHVRWRGLFHGAFSGAVFKRILVWPQRQQHAFAALSDARLEGGISMNSKGEAVERATFTRVSLPTAKGLGLSGLRTLEGGARVLREAFADVGDATRSHLYHRFELIARQNQVTSSPSERLASRLYGCLSDYGLSLVRPGLILIGVAFVFAILFGLLAPLAGQEVYTDITIKLGAPIHPSIASALELALANMFGPFSYFIADHQPYASLVESNRAGFAFRLFMGALSVLQQIISLLLIFLFGLAVRRRFQIG